MISTSIISLGALALAAVSTAKPIPAFKDVLAKRGHSFNGYGGYDTMSNFDDFYGHDDFSGTSQKYYPDKEVVCHSVQIEVVQQQLSVIREWYKKIVTEQICEVEVQTIVHQQFISGCENFCDDIRRTSDRHVSYDHDIASRIVDIHDSDNNCVTNDYGFHGYDVGSHSVSYSGDNWSPDYSHSSVSTAWTYAKQSGGYSSPGYISSWSPSYEGSSYGSESSSYDPSSYGSESSSYEPSSYGSESSSYEPSSYGSSYGSSDSYESAPSYGYESAPSYGYESAPSYGYQSAPSYGYQSASYEPSYESASSYGYQSAPSYGYSAAAPSYTAASTYGSSYGSSGSSYGSSGSSYGSSGSSPSTDSSSANSTDVSSSANNSTIASAPAVSSAAATASAAY